MSGTKQLPTDQDIRELCAKVLLAGDVDSFQRILSELRTALREHVVEAENKNLHLILKMAKVKTAVKDGTAE